MRSSRGEKSELEVIILDALRRLARGCQSMALLGKVPPGALDIGQSGEALLGEAPLPAEDFHRLDSVRPGK